MDITQKSEPFITFTFIHEADTFIKSDLQAEEII